MHLWIQNTEFCSYLINAFRPASVITAHWRNWALNARPKFTGDHFRSQIIPRTACSLAALYSIETSEFFPLGNKISTKNVQSPVVEPHPKRKKFSLSSISSFPWEHGFPQKRWNLQSSRPVWEAEADLPSMQLHSCCAAIWAPGLTETCFFHFHFEQNCLARASEAEKDLTCLQCCMLLFLKTVLVSTIQLCSSWHERMQCEL